jgi:hypothetical protein
VRGFIVLEGVKEGDALLNCRLHRVGAGRREDHGPEMVDFWRWRKGQDPDDEHAKEHPAVLLLIDRTMIPEEMINTSRVVAMGFPNAPGRSEVPSALPETFRRVGLEIQHEYFGPAVSSLIFRCQQVEALLLCSLPLWH